MCARVCVCARVCGNDSGVRGSSVQNSFHVYSLDLQTWKHLTTTLPANTTAEDFYCDVVGPPRHNKSPPPPRRDGYE